MSEQKNFLTVCEFAEKIRVHPNTIRRAIQKGRIQAFRTGEGLKSSYRIPNTEVQRLCELDMSKLIEQIVEKKLEGKI
jgi:excisionase family DNA binding protein